MIYLSVLLTVLSSTLYHFFLKRVSQGGQSLFAMLFWSYLGAAAVCFVGSLLTRSNLVSGQMMDKGMLIPMGLSLALVGIEVGYLWSYRQGGQMSQVTVLTQAAGLIVSLVIGYLIWNEPLTAKRMMGLASALVGVALLRGT